MEVCLSRRQKKIMDMLMKEKGYCTAYTLAKQLHVSEKTIHGEIVDINTKACDTIISSYKGKGYLLSGKEKSGDITFLVEQEEGRRDIKILKEILFKQDVDYYELADHFYISPSTLNKDIRSLNERIQKEFHHLRIMRKQNHVYLNCDDEEKRKVLTYFLLEESENQRFDITILDQYFEAIDVPALSAVLIAFHQKQHIQMSDFNVFAVLLHILMYLSQPPYVAIHPLNDIHCDEPCASLILEIEEKCHVYFTQKGIEQIVSLYQKNNCETEKNEKSMVFINTVLKEVSDIYNMSFNENEELKENLALHIHNLQERCKTGLSIKNPILSQLKQNFVLVYDIAAYIALRFREDTGYELDENEISFIALHILNAIKSIKTSTVRMAIINPYGNSINSMIRQRLNRIENIEIIGCFSMFDFNTLYAEKPDMIISLVTIQEQMGIPVYKLENYLAEEEYVHLQEKIRQLRVKKSYETIIIHNYFKEELFCVPKDVKTKDEVIQLLCEKLNQHGYVKEDFIEQIYEREAIAPTCFGSCYAIPHTTKKVAKKNGIAVALLPKPVSWNGFPVQAVLMFALHESFDQVPKLYDLILTVFDEEDKWKKVLACKQYSDFMKQLHNVK